jgi:hypothetical protein
VTTSSWVNNSFLLALVDHSDVVDVDLGGPDVSNKGHEFS